MMNVTEPLVYIIVITFNGRHHLELCLPSLVKTNYSNYRIILLDNASSDGAAEYVQTAYPQVQIIRNPENYGFAKGNNIAMAEAIRAGSDYILLLNDDTVILDSDWLRNAISVADAEPYTAMVGFDLTADLNKQPPLQRSVRNVDRISGCALLLKSDPLQTLGLFDETYFAYGEESDLEVRAMRAGYRLREVNAPVYHKGSGSFSKTPVRFAYLFMRNWIRFSVKNESAPKTILRPFLVFDVMCNPFPLRTRPADKAVRNRFSTGRLGLNFLLLIGAVLWNIVYLPQTLVARNHDQKKVMLAKRTLAKETA